MPISSTSKGTLCLKYKANTPGHSAKVTSCRDNAGTFNFSIYFDNPNRPNPVNTIAILEGLPGIKVSIESQGRALQEYEDEEGWSNTKYTVPENNRKSAYVECTSDAEF